MSTFFRALLCCALLLPSLARAEIRVEVLGVSGELKSNAEAYLTIRDEAARKDLDQATVERLHRQAGPQLREALRPFGYYNPFIDAHLEGEAPQWRATYTIDPGPRTTLTHVDLDISGPGAEDFEREQRRMRRRLEEGQPLLHSDYDEAKSLLASAAYAKGYLDAHYILSELRVKPSDNTAEAVLHFETGPQYRFGDFTIVQQDGSRKLDDGFLRRYVPIKPGAVYDPQVLLDTQFALGDLGYFDSVEIVPQRDAAVDRRVPLVINTTPRKSQRYEFGLGYGTDTGARGLFGVDFRRLNDTGHTLHIETQISEIKDEALVEYRIPLGNKAGELFSITGNVGEQDYNAGTSYLRGVGIGLARSPGKWQRRYYLKYLHENSNLGTDTVIADLLMPGLTLNRAELNDTIYTRKGWSLFGDVHGGARNMASTVSFIQLHLIGKAAWPVDWNRSRLLLRYEYGANSVEDFGRLPASQRFFAGGDESVRGYGYQSLGPKDSEGNVIGGNYLTTFSGEFETPVWKNWGAAVFLDGGGADDHPAPELHYGVGAGVRYRSPVGSVQLDLAHPLDRDESPVRLHFGVRIGL
ncbi:autotransporter assembly complex protein TamA [Solimonas soli]|uniref:autotransporter assembly complex protein TamA n=1 Tax=Solimonas soli TaxID=413479 RepID=UPI0004B4490C|nr:autotransporter assembly complex family protein [Solimonas soli]